MIPFTLWLRLILCCITFSPLLFACPVCINKSIKKATLLVQLDSEQFSLNNKLNVMREQQKQQRQQIMKTILERIQKKAH